MSQYVIATTKSWNINNCRRLAELYPKENFCVITEKDELNIEFLKKLNPRYIFFPHWSWIIPKEIFEKYECIVFHMTDLPFGRGGSPLQNLLVRGIYKTKISAIKVGEGLDEGPIYMKQELDIGTGNANEILMRISEIVFDQMIPKLIAEDLIPIPQEGVPVNFKRRIPEQSEIPEGLSLQQLYDYIRMLDGEGYPMAFKDIGDIRLYFKNAQLEGDKIYAEACFTRRSDE